MFLFRTQTGNELPVLDVGTEDVWASEASMKMRPFIVQ